MIIAPSIDHSSTNKKHLHNTRTSSITYYKGTGRRLITERVSLPDTNINQVALGHFLVSCTEPRFAKPPQKVSILNPSDHLPEYFLEVQRRSDQTPQLTIPQSWHRLGYVVYMWIDGKGKPRFGRTGNLPRRLSQYLADFEGSGNASHSSLAKAWRNGERLYVGVWHVCSTEQTSKLWETSAIVHFQSHIIGHNDNIGNGPADIINGSPAKGSKVARDLNLYPEDAVSRNEVPVVDPKGHPATPYAELRKSKKTGRYYWDYSRDSDQLGHLKNVIYQFTLPNGKVYIGKTEKTFKKRMYNWLCHFNHPGKNPPPLCRAIQQQGDRIDFKVGVLYKASHEETLRNWETIFIRDKDSITNGFNQNLGNGDPSLTTGSPNYKQPTSKVLSKERAVGTKLIFD